MLDIRIRWARVTGIALAVTSSTSHGHAAEEMVPGRLLVQLGAGIGFSRYYEKAKAPNQSQTKIRSRSLSSSLDLHVGGAVVPGLALGAGFSARSMLDPSLKVNGVLLESTSDTLGLGALSLFGQWYPGWVPAKYGQVYLRAEAGLARSSVQFHHPTLRRERQYGPVLGGVLGYTFAKMGSFHFSAEGMGLASWPRASCSGAHVKTSWYSGTYGLTVAYY